jgi:chemotaxis protein CheX
MADMNLLPSAELVRPDKTNGYVVSTVQILGSWEGAVRLDMDFPLTKATTGGMLGIEASEISNDDVRDAAGELANMVGGGFKNVIEDMLSEPCELSLPEVAMGDDFDIVIGRRAQVVLEASFVSAFGRLVVTVIEKKQ